MRRSLERFAWRMWRGEAGPAGRTVRLLLLPVEGAWRFAARVRNRRWDRIEGAAVPGLAVVSVGNLAVGGTGKTPLSAWVARALRKAGGRPALLLRGYGEDEERLHRLWDPDLPVVAGADRTEGARRARASGADCAVLDDGFQHRHLARDLDVVLLAAEDPVPAPLLPRGPYREPLESLRRADAVIVTRRSAPATEARSRAEDLTAAGYLRGGALTAGAWLAPDEVVPLTVWASSSPREGRSQPETAAAPGGASEPAPTRGADAGPMGGAGALAVTAIARPDAFVRDLEALGAGPVELLAFADHHDFSRHDAVVARRQAGDRPIFLTEKDAVKLSAFAEALGDARVVLQRVRWDWGEAEIRGRLAAVLGGRGGDRP